MFWSSNKKNNVCPCKSKFYYIKVGLRGSKLYRHVFVTLWQISDDDDDNDDDDDDAISFNDNKDDNILSWRLIMKYFLRSFSFFS